MQRIDIREVLNKKPYLKDDLFIRGFLITNKLPTILNDFPFYGKWIINEYNGYYFISHKLTNVHFYKDKDNDIFFIMGHAYNPFTMEYREEKILEEISKCKNSDEYIDKINDLTGVFVLGNITKNGISYLVDSSGMQSACSGIIDNTFYLSSHAQLIGDVCNLKMDDFVEELINYKWYGRVMGPYLPADLTPFKELKRVVPSFIYNYEDQNIEHKRFWPLQNIEIANDEETYKEVIKEASTILKNNMTLVSKKWKQPYISLTGGIDSNTTFAAANGIYDKFKTFSYISAEKEVIDAKAAEEISEHFNVDHLEYHIPDENKDINDFEERRELFRHNNGYVAELYDNEIRKKLYLRDNTDFDVEVKSWVSETIRAYWYKHYGRTSFPKLSAKLYRNLYKIFIFNRVLAYKVDKVFEKYLKEYEYELIPLNYPPADIHYNEMTWGSWGGLNISEMKYCFDITFIYNNRRFFDLMFKVPLNKRISDEHHLDLKRELNKELADMNIRVKNLKETNIRAFLLNVIFTINSILPF